MPKRESSASTSNRNDNKAIIYGGLIALVSTFLGTIFAILPNQVTDSIQDARTRAARYARVSYEIDSNIEACGYWIGGVTELEAAWHNPKSSGYDLTPFPNNFEVDAWNEFMREDSVNLNQSGRWSSDYESLRRVFVLLEHANVELEQYSAVIIAAHTQKLGDVDTPRLHRALHPLNIELQARCKGYLPLLTRGRSTITGELTRLQGQIRQMTTGLWVAFVVGLLVFALMMGNFIYELRRSK